MVGAGLFVEALLGWLLENSQTAMLALIAGGAYYELHHGRIATMAENQYVLGTAVYALLTRADDLNEDKFRSDLWDEDDDKTYPGDWEQEPPEPPDP